MTISANGSGTMSNPCLDGSCIHGLARTESPKDEPRRQPEDSWQTDIAVANDPGVFVSFVGTKEAPLFNFGRTKVRIEIF